MNSILLNQAAGSGSTGMVGMVIWLVILFVAMYFMMIRPQKKEQQKKDLMLSSWLLVLTVRLMLLITQH